MSIPRAECSAPEGMRQGNIIMQTAQEEEYVFYRFASGDMLQALSTLKDLPKYKKRTTRHALLQQTVLSYCRPFKSWDQRRQQ